MGPFPGLYWNYNPTYGRPHIKITTLVSFRLVKVVEQKIDEKFPKSWDMFVVIFSRGKTINKTLNKHKVWRFLSLLSFTFGQSVYLKKQPKQIINSVENDHLVGGFNPFEK